MEIISNNTTAVNTVEVEFRASAEEFEEAVQAAYLRRRKNIIVPGFRKGKASRKMIETHYGEGVFYEDAINGMYRKQVADVIEQLKLDVVDMPNIEVVSVKKEEGINFKAVFTTKPEVNISDYKGLKVNKTVKTITDEDIDKELSRKQNDVARSVEVDDRPAQNSDTVVFDFEGFVDGVPFEGGKATNFSLELGSGRFIPGFEEQVVGKSIGEDFEVNVTFPEKYPAAEIAGKAAVFKCKIHSIMGKELPALDDDFAKDVSEFDTIAEYREDIKKNLEEQEAQRADNQLETDINNQLIDKLEGEIPPVMYENRITEMVRDWEYRNRYQGINVSDYLKYTGTTEEQFREGFRDAATKQIKLRLALEKIAALENLEASEEEISEQYDKLAEEHKMDLEKVKSIVSSENLGEDIKVEKAFKLVKESADVTEG